MVPDNRGVSLSGQTSWRLGKERHLSSPRISFCSPVLEKIRSAVGSTQLLLSQKVQQFFRLCQQSMVSAHGTEPIRCVYLVGDWSVCMPGSETRCLSCLVSLPPSPLPTLPG